MGDFFLLFLIEIPGLFGADLCKTFNFSCISSISLGTYHVCYLFFPYYVFSAFCFDSLRAEQMFYFSVLLMLLYAYSLQCKCRGNTLSSKC